MSSSNARAAGLGSLLQSPTPPADADEEFAAHRARRGSKAKPKAKAAPELTWLATDTETFEEIARVTAPDQETAIARVTEETGRRGKFAVSLVDPETGGPALVPARTTRTSGALAHRGAGAMLPRRRAARVAKDKLTCQIAIPVLDALDELVARDDSRKYDEVEEALRKHLAAKGITVDEG